MRYCFDTSAVSELIDDTARDSIVQGLLVTNTVYVTALSVVEACKYESPDRRTRLLEILGTLSGEVRPLGVPNDILIRSARAFENLGSDYAGSIGPEQDDLWVLLQMPSAFNEAHLNLRESGQMKPRKH